MWTLCIQLSHSYVAAPCSVEFWTCFSQGTAAQSSISTSRFKGRRKRRGVIQSHPSSTSLRVQGEYILCYPIWGENHTMVYMCLLGLIHQLHVVPGVNKDTITAAWWHNDLQGMLGLTVLDHNWITLQWDSAGWPEWSDTVESWVVWCGWMDQCM